jgi:hypothetical protein
VAVALALEELDRMKAMDCLPEPEALLKRLQARSFDFNLLVGVTAVYLRLQEGELVQVSPGRASCGAVQERER